MKCPVCNDTTDVTGAFRLCNNDSCSWFDKVREIKTYGNNASSISAPKRIVKNRMEGRRADGVKGFK